ncbi:4-Cys prefix domain-containing protein [Crocosphaera sp. UHCC 0190]|uniref:4-Cys prefix domain-containing protein n=1 Tax=Crocosphaera sp. UHCC 0190 TaxID=3110246 RepID=UPI002B1F804C|nr:4-Cys prefix domain-containing protein [Crocosphaera sp. UHCC 0190]MEA5509317.1 4-Cys prefix domain-containing protein [Crocosphaera sp. UHCC 0190]
MSLCINPNCTQPDNPDNHHLYCQTCGSELLLEGLYRVSEKLGEGGFGITYIISNSYQNINKVLKVLTLNIPDALRLFQNGIMSLQNWNRD